MLHKTIYQFYLYIITNSFYVSLHDFPIFYGNSTMSMIFFAFLAMFTLNVNPLEGNLGRILGMSLFWVQCIRIYKILVLDVFF